MWKRLLSTCPELGALVLRLSAAVVFFPHGAQKMLGWFGGRGFSATMEGFTGMGMPPVVAFLVIVTEFFGALLLLFGFLSRLAALGIGAIMVGAIVLVHGKQGFFMNWGGGMPAGQEGFEFHILALAVLLVVLIKGGGLLSVDRWLWKRTSPR
jgi:putative oxidoreductase